MKVTVSGNPPTEIGDPQVCLKCAALVGDMDHHTAWHESLEGQITACWPRPGRDGY
jgi:hypothetical protein